VRLLLLASLLVFAACKKREAPADPPPAPNEGSAAPEVVDLTPKAAVVDDPMFHIRPEEAQVSIAPLRAHVGAAGHTTVTVVPARGFHVSKEYKAKLDLGADARVAMTGRSEQALSFDITATPKVVGEQHIEGFLHVGICESKSCRPRKHPVSIAVIGD